MNPSCRGQWGHLRPSAVSFTVVKHSNSQSRIQEVESCESVLLPLTINPDNLDLCRVTQALMMKRFAWEQDITVAVTETNFIFSISCLSWLGNHPSSVSPISCFPSCHFLLVDTQLHFLLFPCLSCLCYLLLSTPSLAFPFFISDPFLLQWQ